MTFHSMMKNKCIVDLPWNLNYSFLAVLTVDFHHHSTKEVVCAVRQRAGTIVAVVPATMVHGYIDGLNV